MKKFIITHSPLPYKNDLFRVICIDTDKSDEEQIRWFTGGDMEHILKHIQSNKETLYEKEEK